MNGHPDRRDYWNDRYATQGLVWGGEANQFVAAELSGLTPRRVLDLGCGQGRNAIWLARQGHDVTAIDVSDVAIEQAKVLADEAGVHVTWTAHDLATWQPEPETYDLVVLSYLQLPDTTRRVVHAGAVAALTPGGRIFLIAHHRDNLERGIGGPQSVDVLYDEPTLAQDFAGLEMVRNDVVLRPVDHDGGSGNAIDVLVIAQKPSAGDPRDQTRPIEPAGQ